MTLGPGPFGRPPKQAAIRALESLPPPGAVGSIYRTWVVRFEGDKLACVSYFRSRRGEAAEDTLPPDD